MSRYDDIHDKAAAYRKAHNLPSVEEERLQRSRIADRMPIGRSNRNDKPALAQPNVNATIYGTPDKPIRKNASQRRRERKDKQRRLAIAKAHALQRELEQLQELIASKQEY